MATGFLIDAHIPSALARAASLWAPGCRVGRAGETWVIVDLPETRVAVEEAPGQPLVHRGGAYLGADGPPSRADGQVYALVGGRWGPLDVDWSVRPSAWLDLRAVRRWVADEVVTEPARVLTMPPVDTVRGLVGDAVPPADPQAADVRNALAQGRPSGTTRSGGVSAGLLRAASWVLSRLRGESAPGGRHTTQPSSPSWLGRLQDRLARALLTTRLGGLLTAAQSRYVDRLLGLLDAGDTREALRFAIPLGGDESASRLSLSVPSGRDSFAISYASGSSGQTIGLHDQVMAVLRSRYQALYERLLARGRLDEALFVLAELLRDTEAAVALFESHGRLREAARLAAARRCRPELVVRLWCRVGDFESALQVLLERHSGFAEAVAALTSRGDLTAAARLRLLWADVLASEGNYAAAVDALNDGASPLTARFIELGLAAPTSDAPRLIKVLAERGGDARGAAASWLARCADEERTDAIVALGDALVTAAPGPEVAALTLEHVGRALRDPAVLERWDRSRLVSLAGQVDKALAADLPNWTPKPKRWPPASSTRYELRGAGPFHVHDAVLLPRGDLLLACGESGAYLVDGSGDTLAHFDAPAFELAATDQGGRAIAVARRGALIQLSRLDLGNGKVQPLGPYRLTTGAASVRGSLWYAADGSRFMGLDISGASARCFWDLDLQAPIRSVSLEKGYVLVETAGHDAEFWHFEWPELTLRTRRRAPPSDPPSGRFALSDVRGASDVDVPLPCGATQAHAEENDDGWTTVLGLGPQRYSEVHTTSSPRLRRASRDLVIVTSGAVGLLGLDGPRFRTVIPTGRPAG